MIKSGLPTSVMAMPSRWRMPSEKCRAFFLPVFSSPTYANSECSDASFETPSAMLCIFIFWYAVISGYREGVSMMAPVRRRAARMFASFSLRPNREYPPSDGEINPQTRRMTVVLPAPFLPTKP